MVIEMYSLKEINIYKETDININIKLLITWNFMLLKFYKFGLDMWIIANTYQMTKTYIQKKFLKN